MKQYRHKPTDTICEWNPEVNAYQGRNGQFLNFQIPALVVESGEDWEEVKLEPKIPPGIIAFKHADGEIMPYISGGQSYEEWVKYHSVKYRQHIYSVSGKNGEEWSIDEEVDIPYILDHRCIKGFQYENEQWNAIFKDGGSCAVYHLRKTSPNKTLIQRVIDLENMFGTLKMYIKNL